MKTRNGEYRAAADLKAGDRTSDGIVVKDAERDTVSLVYVHVTIKSHHSDETMTERVPMTERFWIATNPDWKPEDAR